MDAEDEVVVACLAVLVVDDRRIRGLDVDRQTDIAQVAGDDVGGLAVAQALADLPDGVPMRSELMPSISAGLRAVSVKATQFASRFTSPTRGLYSIPAVSVGRSL